MNALLPWLSHLWQSTVVAAAILVLLATLKTLPARTRLALGWIAVAKFALPMPWLAAWVEGAGGPDAAQPWLLSEPWVLPVPTSAAGAAAEAVSHAPGLAEAGVSASAVVGTVWALGALAVGGGWIARAWRARRRALGDGTVVEGAIIEELARAAGCVGLRRVPRCRWVEAESGPALVGVFAPTLVLPRGLVASLKAAELEAILLHECIHARRRDNFWSAVRAGFVAVLWFNPVAWLLNRVLAIETEKACDEGVLEITGDPDAYAGGIVAAVRHAIGGGVPAGIAAAATPPVVARIRAIFAYPARRERPWARRAAISAAAALVVLSGRVGSLAAEPVRAEAKQAPATASEVAPAGTPAALRVRNVTIRFDGAASVTEADVRAVMTLRPGGEMNEKSVDADIRAIYALGAFQSVELKYEKVDAGTVDLIVQLTPKARQMDATPQGPPRVPLVTSASDEAGWELRETDLADARKKLEEAKARLERLKQERSAALAAHKALDEKIGVAARGGVGDDTAEASRSLPPAERGVPSALTDLRPRPLSPPAVGPQVPVETLPTLWGKPIYELSAVDRQPMPRFQTRPRYPFELRKAGVAGEVVVEFIVDDRGEVVNARAVRSSREEFEFPALEAVSRWRFRAGVKDGQTVPTRMQVPIVFTPDER